ncbi:MAG TPA: hypothetical protein VKC59_07090, partial [Candidatus Limnocylindrales bacterium]|nr:hypothetical protein [Candidatus Limnocylindrales bacterium]
MRHRRPMLMSAVVALVLTTIGTASVIAAVQFRGPQPAYFVGLDGNVTSVENAADWVLRVIGSGLVSWSKRG